MDDPEYVRQMQRPVEVKQDVRQMEDRKRVNMILKSKAFRQELEQIVNEQLKTGPQQSPDDRALQQLASLFPQQSRLRQAVGAVYGMCDMVLYSALLINSYATGAFYE